MKVCRFQKDRDNGWMQMTWPYYGIFAPTAVETDGEASHPGPRLRKRGPRSAVAISERRAANSRRHEDRVRPTEESAIWNNAKFKILHVNIRGWISHAAELLARIRLMNEKSDLICVNETFLDRTIEHISFEGYALIARRDRADGRKCGGIAALS